MPSDAPGAVERVCAALGAGRAVVLPTDTVYGVAVLPGNEELLARLKGRPAEMPIAVLVASVEQAAEAAGGSLPGSALRLAAAFWPGPLTLVVPAPGGTVGLRLPDHDLVRAVASDVGPIATTSANRHGTATPPTAAEAAASLVGDGVALVVDGGTLGAVASTVVDLSRDEAVVLREGALAASTVLAAVVS